jgi:hypothetical protein
MEIVQNLRKIVLTVAVTAVLLFVLAFAGKFWENVDADEIACIQSPISGKLKLVHQRRGQVAGVRQGHQIFQVGHLRVPRPGAL